MQCPICQKKLEKLQIKGRGIYHRCAEHGAYASELYIERLNRGAQILKDLKSSPIQPYTHKIPCAYCRHPMSQRLILKRIPIEHCGRCRLLWFDRGEIEEAEKSNPQVAVRKKAPLDLPSRSPEVQAQMAVDPFFLPDTAWQFFASDGLEKKAKPGVLAIPLIILMAVIHFSLSRKGLSDNSIWLFFPDWSLLRNGVRILTSGFAHFEFWHLFSNVYFMWIFMDDIEEEAGPLTTFLLFCGGVIVGNVASTLVGPQLPGLGASGGVFALLSYFAVQFPNRRFNVIMGRQWVYPITMWIVPIPVWMYLGFKIVTEFVLVAEGAANHSSIGHAAHCGGAIVGILVALWKGSVVDPATRRST